MSRLASNLGQHGPVQAENTGTLAVLIIIQLFGLACIIIREVSLLFHCSLQVFRAIFEKTRHIEHYKMMMGDEYMKI